MAPDEFLAFFFGSWLGEGERQSLQISTAAFGITESASMQSIARRTTTARLDTTGVIIIIIIIMIMIIIATTRIGTPPFPIPSLGRVGRFSELLRASPSFSELLRASSRFFARRPPGLWTRRLPRRAAQAPADRERTDSDGLRRPFGRWAPPPGEFDFVLLFNTAAMPSTAVFSMTGTRAQGCIASMRGPRNVPHVSHVLASMPLVSRTLRDSRQMARHIVSAKKKKGGKKGGDASEEPVVESSKVRFLSGHRRRCRRGPVDEWTSG